MPIAAPLAIFLRGNSPLARELRRAAVLASTTPERLAAACLEATLESLVTDPSVCQWLGSRAQEKDIAGQVLASGALSPA